MKRSTIVIGVAMAILCIPAAQTVASALGIGLGPVGEADFAASVYANVSDGACGYASDYAPDDFSFSSTSVCATTDHARLGYAFSDDAAGPPTTRGGSSLWFSTYSCQRVLVETEWGSYYSYECDWDSYAGAIPSDAVSVDPLLASGSIRTTVETQQGNQCEIDVVFDTPDGPRAGNDQWSYADPSHTLSVSMGSAAGALARSAGSMAGTTCGTPTGPSSYAQVSRGAGLNVQVSASVTPASS
ncbi:MAG: hypothetical protein ACT452_19855 [Microthrixaceae bacterium]